MTDISKNTELQQSCITAVMHSAELCITVSLLGEEADLWKLIFPKPINVN